MVCKLRPSDDFDRFNKAWKGHNWYYFRTLKLTHVELRKIGKYFCQYDMIIR